MSDKRWQLADLLRRDNRLMMGKLLVVVALMSGFGYALVPVYRAVCTALGINVLTLAEGTHAVRAEDDGCTYSAGTWDAASPLDGVRGEEGWGRVTEAAAPFFARRFADQPFSLLTPDACAHWDTLALTFTPGADPAEQAEGEDWDNNSSAHLIRAVQELDPRSRDILQRRWMGENKATLQELASEYGVSAERIRQIEASAITRLRRLLPGAAV